MSSRTEWSTSSLWWTLQSTSWVCSTNPTTILHKKPTARQMSSSQCSIFGIQRWVEFKTLSINQLWIYQASAWASKKSKEFKAYVRSTGEFGDVGFKSQGKKKTEVWSSWVMSWKHVKLSLQFDALHLKAVTRHCHFGFVVYHGGQSDPKPSSCLLLLCW